MYRYLIALAVLLGLSACSPAAEGYATDTATDTQVESTALTDYHTELPEDEAPVGFYGGGEGEYARVSAEAVPFETGAALAELMVIPSDFTTISGDYTYGELWSHMAGVIGEPDSVRPTLLLEYTLSDGISWSREICSAADAEAENAVGYFEVILSDDVHGDDSGKFTITSVKLIGGERIGEVVEVTLTAYLDGSPGGKITLTRE